MFAIQNGQQYINNLSTGKIKRKHEQNIIKVFSEYGKKIQEDLEKIITTGSRSGKKYYYKGVSFTASAPGEPPTNRNGRLASSFGFNARQRELAIWNNAVSKNNAPYPYFLEHGTSRISPRPYFIMTIEKYQEEIRSELEGLKNLL